MYIDKEARDVFRDLYKYCRAITENITDDDKYDCIYYEGVYDTLSKLSDSLGIDEQTGDYIDTEPKDIDVKLKLLDTIINEACEDVSVADVVERLKNLGITDEQIERWGYNDPDED